MFLHTGDIEESNSCFDVCHLASIAKTRKRGRAECKTSKCRNTKTNSEEHRGPILASRSTHNEQTLSVGNGVRNVCCLEKREDEETASIVTNEEELSRLLLLAPLEDVGEDDSSYNCDSEGFVCRIEALDNIEGTDGSSLTKRRKVYVDFDWEAGLNITENDPLQLPHVPTTIAEDDDSLSCSSTLSDGSFWTSSL